MRIKKIRNETEKRRKEGGALFFSVDFFLFHFKIVFRCRLEQIEDTTKREHFMVSVYFFAIKIYEELKNTINENNYP